MTWKLSIFLAGAMAVLAGCRSMHHSELRRFEVQQPHMGTMFSITLYAPDTVVAQAASAAAFARIALLDQMMTDYDPESELMQLCQKPPGQPVQVSAELFYVLQKGQRIAELSDGAFDVTIGPVVRLWRRARRTEELPPAEMLARARAAVGWQNLKLDARASTVTLLVPHMQLDLGGLAKGYAAEQALAAMKPLGVTRALVAASGDIALGEPPPGKRGWRVSIGAARNDAAGSSNAITRAPFARTLLLKNAAVSTSGDSEQFVIIEGKRYSHIVDPRTGIGLTERLQVSVIARHGVDSDSFDTAMSVLGLERGLKLIDSQPGLAAFILRKRGNQTEVFESKRFKRIPQVE